MRRLALACALAAVACGGAARGAPLSPKQRAALAAAIKALGRGKPPDKKRPHDLPLGVTLAPERFSELVDRLNDSDLERLIERLKSVYPDESGRAVGPLEPADPSAPAAATAIGASVGALVPANRIFGIGGGRYELIGTSYAQRYNTCAEVPYGDQEVIASCTTFLVGPGRILTAGHCVPSDAAEVPPFLAANRIVFGYRKEGASVRTTVDGADVYRITGVAARATAEGEDWAILDLDRAATGRAPLARAGAAAVERKQKLFALGYPDGLPLKVALGFVLAPAPEAPSFVAALDTFHGNSGSPVIDLASGRVLGVLVRGAEDLIRDPARNCNHFFVCGADGACDGESVMRISRIPQ